jgi:putative DNA primase/helicase
MTAGMLIPTESANEQTNSTRRANVERVRRFIEVRAANVWPGKVLVVCQIGLETALLSGELPENVAVRHYNDIAGENAYSDVALLIAIGRTEPSPPDIERTARALFGAEVAEIIPDDKGAVRYPRVVRGIRIRDGTGRAVEGAEHPDPRAEAVRLAICEAGLIQAIGRGRGVNRTADNPLEIDILTNIVLPIEVDELTTWEHIQPTHAEVMRSRGAVPLSYADMVAAYPDLFPSPMALNRENPEQMPIENRFIGVCSGFCLARYRRRGSRGPAGRLLYNPVRIDLARWLADHIGDVVILSVAEQIAAPEPVEIEPDIEEAATETVTVEPAAAVAV